jgi:Flp pilus assembly protein TadD
VARIIRICKLSLVTALLAGTPVEAKNTGENNEADLFWKAQRAELSGKSDAALKNYNRLLGKLPESSVAVDRLFDVAIKHGDLPSALKAARAQQLSNSGDAALPLIFFVDAWKRGDYDEAVKATEWLRERNIFGFLTSVLDAWIDVARGKQGTISNAALRESGLLQYYSFDQLIFLDLANKDVESAQRRLSSFPGFADDYARHMAMTAAEYLGQNGEAEYANTLLQHLGAEPAVFSSKPQAFPSEQALAGLFSRLSEQLNEQGIADQSLYFARLSNWIASDSVYGRMTLAKRFATSGSGAGAISLLDGIAPTRPQWSWALGDKARILIADGKSNEALSLVQNARLGRPDAQDLVLLEAQQLEANKQFSAASALYRKLVTAADASGAKNGRRVTFRLLLAQSLQVQGRRADADTALEQALALNSENPQILNMLGYSLLEQREDIKRGFELVSKAHRLSPQSPAITDSLGWAHYLNGEFETAVPLLEKAVQGAINDVTINEHLGDAYWQAGRGVDARYAWRSALLQAEGEAAKRIASKADIGWSEATAAP